MDPEENTLYFIAHGLDGWLAHTDLYILDKGASGKTGIPSSYSASSDELSLFNSGNASLAVSADDVVSNQEVEFDMDERSDTHE